MLDLKQGEDILISYSEDAKGIQVRILVRKEAGGKFKKKIFEIGDIVYLKTIPAEAWETNSVLILVTEDGKENSESYGFHPEELEFVKQDSE